VIRVGGRINVYKGLVRTPEGKRPLRRPECKSNDSAKIKLGGVR